jgi:hypothetical protein
MWRGEFRFAQRKVYPRCMSSLHAPLTTLLCDVIVFQHYAKYGQMVPFRHISEKSQSSCTNPSSKRLCFRTSQVSNPNSVFFISMLKTTSSVFSATDFQSVFPSKLHMYSLFPTSGTCSGTPAGFDHCARASVPLHNFRCPLTSPFTISGTPLLQVPPYFALHSLWHLSKPFFFSQYEKPFYKKKKKHRQSCFAVRCL